MYITFTSKKANKAEPTLALKPRGDVTRNPKQAPQKGHVYAKIKIYIYTVVYSCSQTGTTLWYMSVYVLVCKLF